MQTKKTKEKKSKKTVSPKARQFFHHGVYIELLGQYNSFSPAQSDCNDQVFIDYPLVREKDNNNAV